MAQNIVTLGLQHYQWAIHQHPWLNIIDCTICNIVDLTCVLSIVIEGTKASSCDPSKVKKWIALAVQQGWNKDSRAYQLVDNKQQIQLQKLDFSISQEVEICQKLATKFNKNPSSLEKSNLKFHLSKTETKLGLTFPTILKLLYLQLGNGNFGPDNGFFTLVEDNSSHKISLEQAYQEVHNSTIKDWDWELPKSWLPFLYWGADIYSFVDCSGTSNAIYVLDKNLKKEQNTWQSCTWLHQDSMVNWLEQWLKGDVFGQSLWLEMYRIKGLI